MALVVCGLLLSACGGSETPSTTPTRADASEHVETSAPAEPRAEPLSDASPSHCPGGVPGCRTASGRIVYIEAVDPDGDGDAHFILAGADSITAPGLSIIDIAADLRPKRLPHLGTSVSAAGPVQRGHLGQHQIHAIELHIASRGR